MATEIETYETVKSTAVSAAVSNYVYLNALATKDIVLSDKSGSYHKPDHKLAQFETKYQAEHKPNTKKGEAKYTYSKITITEDDATGEKIHNREIMSIKKFFNLQNADLKHFLEFFLVALCKEYSVFFPKQKGKYEPAATFDKKFSETVEKELAGTVARFIFTIGTVSRVDAMVTETVITPELTLMKEMEGYYGTAEKRPMDHLRAITAAYLKFCKLVAVFLANNLMECTATITLEDLLALLRHFNAMQRADGSRPGEALSGQLNNCIFDELTVYVKSRRTTKAKKGEAEPGSDMQDDLTEEITGEKPTVPKAATKPAAAKGAKGKGKGAAAKTTSKKAAGKAAAKPAAAAEDDFEDTANGADELDELDA